MSDQQVTIPLREKIFDENSFMSFVQGQIDKFKVHAEIVKNPEQITLTDLNIALCEYSIVRSALLSLQALARIEARKKSEDFEQWFSERYVETRSRENPKDLAGNKWAGAKEIERMVRVEHYFVYKNLKEQMDMAELKEQFLGRMVQAWADHQFVLNTISKNIQTEVMISKSGLEREAGE